VWRYIGDPSQTVDQTRERLERYGGWEREHGYTLWAVVERESGRLVGDCGMIPLEGHGPEVELGYRFDREHWGRGYATEAAVAVRDLGFDRFGLERIYVDVHLDNAASQNVARKLRPSDVRPARHQGHPVIRFVLERPGRVPD
jgi:[ribosomal protein S5]-alanine N-acetyltransferase